MDTRLKPKGHEALIEEKYYAMSKKMQLLEDR